MSDISLRHLAYEKKIFHPRQLIMSYPFMRKKKFLSKTLLSCPTLISEIEEYVHMSKQIKIIKFLKKNSSNKSYIYALPSIWHVSTFFKILNDIYQAFNSRCLTWRTGLR